MLTRRTANGARARDAALLIRIKGFAIATFALRATLHATAARAPSRALSRRRSGGVTLSHRRPPDRRTHSHRRTHRLHSHRRHPHRRAHRRHTRRRRVASVPRRRHLLLLQNARHLHLVRHRGARFHRGGVARVDLRLELRVVVADVRQVLEPEVMLLPGVLLRFTGKSGGKASVRNSRGAGSDLGVEPWRVLHARREFAGTHRVVRQRRLAVIAAVPRHLPRLLHAGAHRAGV